MKKKRMPSSSRKKLSTKGKGAIAASRKTVTVKKTGITLTKKLEDEILKLYHAYWDAYLRGDWKTFASYLDDDLVTYGTAAGEIFDSKKEALKFYKATADQIAGKADLRKRKISVKAVGNTVVTHEQCDLFVLMDGVWTLYGHARITAIFEQKGNTWKVVHQHGSFPDSRADEGEQINTDKIKAENIQLKEAVKRRTIQLEEKNRELEIEAAVERVRAKAMAMHKSGEIIQVANVLRIELDGLKIPGIASATITLQQENDNIRLWDITSVVEAKDGFSFSMDIMFRLAGTKPDDWIRRVWDGMAPYFVFKQDSKSLKKTVSWIHKYKPEFAENAKRWLESNHVKNVWHPVVSMSHGKLSLDLIQEPVVEVEAILTKMGASFDLAYKRFLDLQKAEAQAREAQIETSLERVRSRSMAMRTSQELGEVIQLVFEQLRLLNFTIDSAQFDFDYKKNNDVNIWIAVPGQEYSTMLHVPYIDNAVFNSTRHAIANGLDSYSVSYTQEEKIEFFHHFFKQIKYVSDERKELLLKSKGFARSVVLMDNFWLGIQNYSGIPYSEYELVVLKRFAKVFEQTYTRFLDLQKAEAQAREAQVEAALERVRSRTMAMHKSEQLPETAQVLFEQFALLGKMPSRISIGIINEELQLIEWWATDQQGSQLNRQFTASVKEPTHAKIYTAWKAGSNSIVIDLTGPELKEWIRFVRDEVKMPMDETLIKGRRLHHAAFFAQGLLLCSTNEPMAEDTMLLLVRFGNVFNQTYTRFLDLQKAEAQAREAQIEAGLERVRSKTMAMHNSQDVGNTVASLFDELVILGLEKSARCGIGILDESNKNIMELWTASTNDQGELVLAIGHLDMTLHPLLKGVKKTWSSKKQSFTYELQGEDLINYFNTLNDYPDYNIYIDIKTLPDKIIHNSFYFTDGVIYCFTSNSISEDLAKVVKRFAGVFGQTYKRYLDLKKAEAQAREAQIEAALERVRSRSLAMHKSEELREVIQLVFEQLRLLNFNVDSAQFDLNYKESDDLNVWTAVPGQLYPIQQYIPYFANPIMYSVKQAKKNGLTFLSHVCTYEEKNEFFRHFFNHVKHVPEERKKYIFDTPGYARSVVFLDNLFLGIQNYAGIPYTETENAVLRRFGKVFNQTYTRFLDLQKAEAQAREAKIEAALEKVRSRTMAMQKSEELRNVVKVIFDQLVALNFNISNAGFLLDYKESDDYNAWMVDAFTELPTKQHIPYFEHPFNKDYVESKNKGLELFTKVYSNEEKNTWFEGVWKYLTGTTQETKDILLSTPALSVSRAIMNNVVLYSLNFNGIPFSDAENDILIRFAKVFEQTYTRFLDLQKAEAQARESQIQLALERVRAKTMAMQSSNDLLGVANVLREQMGNLGQPELESSIVHLYNDTSLEAWYAFRPPNLSSGEIITGVGIVPKDCSVWSREVMAKYNSPETEYTIVASGEKLMEWYKILEQYASPTIEYDENGQLVVPEILNYHFSKFSGGALLMISNQEPSAEARELQSRAAKVFEQAYIRFLDLQKAEAQAREAKIETALEKVRSRSLAMHKSDEIKAIVKVVFEQLKSLNFAIDGAAFIGIPDTENNSFNIWVGDDHNEYPSYFRLPVHTAAPIADVWKAYRTGADFLSNVYPKEEKNEWFRFAFEHTDFKTLPAELKEWILNQEFLSQPFALAKYSGVGIHFHHYRELLPTEIDILKRFCHVFEQGYIRFLDLQKAEALAREATIEGALEKVRSRSLAMHKSIELIDVVNTVFERLSELGIEHDTTIINTMQEGIRGSNMWIVSRNQKYADSVFLPYIDHSLTKDIWRAYEAGEEVFCKSYSFEEKNEWFKIAFEVSGFKYIPEERKNFLLGVKNYSISTAFVKDISIQLISFSEHVFVPSELEVLKRFTNVFYQSYTRFLDLQKAEVQAREAKIETALERVRAQAMAMHQTEDLGKTIMVYYEQLDDLIDSTIVRCGAGLLNKENTIAEMSTASKSPDGETYHVKGTIDMQGHPLLDNTYEHWLKQKEYHHVLRGNEIKEYYQYITNQVAIPENKGNDELYFYFPMFTEGSFYVVTDKTVPEDELKIFRRFSSVLSLTYRRFNDLLKAEAQAREARIEAALEKVRSRSLAMHSSNELSELVATLFDELVKLDLVLARCIIWILNEDKSAQLWMANSENKQATSYHINAIDHSYYNAIVKGWQERNEHWVYELKDAEKASIDQILLFETELRQLPEEVKQGILTTTQTFVAGAFNKFGLIEASGPVHHTEEQLQILHRFNKVFEQSYTRFLDLQKAEAQAREAQIEASLERVRSKALGMHSSKDLSDSIEVFYKELLSLGVQTRRVGVGLTDRESKITKLSTMNTTEEGATILAEGNLHMEGHRLLEAAFSHWLRQEEFHTSLKGNEINEYYKIVRPQISYPEYPHDATQYGYYFMFPEGAVFAWMEKELPEEELRIFRRFTSVISLTYKRHKELSDAEARAQLAVRNASLDRVRADIASMRSTADLDRITPLIWKELTTLNIPFVRCGVFIMDEPLQQIHTFLSTPDGKAIAAFHLPYDAPGRTSEILASWINKQVYIKHWDETAFSDLGDLLVKQGALPSKDVYLKTVPQGGVHLHCLPFMQGMFYVGNTVELNEDDIQLIQSVADAFATAYARYEDFNKLEIAKQQVDKTLVDLKQTQQQLIQSEKMASLGELTAGIAHEIQNPLNFVNNFSEVNIELIDELTQELAAGNRQSAEDIAKDIKENQQKINHHGKRAEGIVKGMLQHSRTGSGKKELTDINALCDEYLRLSYHGLRAKDKSFNAKFETHFDDTLPKIEVMPQDIGRVVLNLINNAFYVVNERVKRETSEVKPDSSHVSHLTSHFEPTVTVSTKKLSDKIEIRVKDNGNGIPDSIKEKIFQPFFTTKPTGQGTGLGLSLSYDIVKAHGGELRVETKEGEGSEFVVQLPIV